MILGLHNHIKSLTINEKKQFLDECLRQNANIIAITDYNTLSSYSELFLNLTKDELFKYRDLRFILGMELTGKYTYTDINGKVYNLCVDLLAYNLDLNKYQELYKFIKYNYYDCRENELHYLIEICQKIGLKADYDKLEFTENQDVFDILKQVFFNFKYYKDNLSKYRIFEDILNSYNLYNKNIDINSPFYYDKSRYYPELNRVINKITTCGGISFLAHPASYFKKNNYLLEHLLWLDSQKFTTNILNEYDLIKGLEIIHPSNLNNFNFMNFLNEMSMERNLFVTGGTDYFKNGDKITVDFNNFYIDNKRLYNICDWALVYDIYDLVEVGKYISNIEELPHEKVLIK